MIRRTDARPAGRWLRRLPASVCGRFTLIILGLLIATGSIAAQTSPSLPDHSHATRTGWECDRGWIRRQDRCVVVQVPENAFLRTYGRSWECLRGYRRDGDRCIEIAVPPNGFLSSFSAAGWECDGGFRAEGGTCVAVEVVPNTGEAAEHPAARPCGEGVRRAGDGCRRTAIPANGYAVDERYGSGWRCRHGYRERDGSCVAIEVPENAHLIARETRWRCNRGYERVDQSCQEVAVPPNAHLDLSGKRWECSRGYKRLEDRCVLRWGPAQIDS